MGAQKNLLTPALVPAARDLQIVAEDNPMFRINANGNARTVAGNRCHDSFSGSDYTLKKALPSARRARSRSVSLTANIMLISEAP